MPTIIVDKPLICQLFFEKFSKIPTIIVDNIDILYKNIYTYYVRQ